MVFIIVYYTTLVYFENFEDSNSRRSVLGTSFMYTTTKLIVCNSLYDIVSGKIYCSIFLCQIIISQWVCGTLTGASGIGMW